MIVDYAGPAELVTEDTGFKVPIGTREDIVSAFRLKLSEMIENPQKLETLGVAARKRVYKLFTWEVKAKQVSDVYRWIQSQQVAKPDFFNL